MSKIKKYYIDDNLFEDLLEKKFQIWQEGFKIGNIVQEAEYHGEAEGKDFKGKRETDREIPGAGGENRQDRPCL